MREIKPSEGEKLAKVLKYYGFIPGIDTLQQKIICPFHDDLKPSMKVDLQVGEWFCFGCNESGDAFKFVKEIEKLKRKNKINDLDALWKLERILKSKKVEAISIKHNIKPLKADLKEAMDEAYDYFYGLKKVDWRGDNGLEIDTAKTYMIDRGFTPQVLNKIDCRYTYGYSYPLIFPMLDNGEFKGWVCRTDKKEIEQKRKYLYNKGFSRATTLVGNYGKKDYIFVVEGYMDRLKFIQYGVNNVVAILGWKATKNQIEKLQNAGIKTIISALDNDDCGKKGTAYLKNYFKVVRFKYVKGIKDAGEMSKAVFNKCLNKTQETLEKSREKERN